MKRNVAQKRTGQKHKKKSKLIHSIAIFEPSGNRLKRLGLASRCLEVSKSKKAKKAKTKRHFLFVFLAILCRDSFLGSLCKMELKPRARRGEKKFFSHYAYMLGAMGSTDSCS